MEYTSSVFSLLFVAIIFIYLYWGIYVIRLNTKACINKAFLAICISMSLWSLGFALANSALTYETALFWRRISAIGWTSLYSIMLHFLLLLSYENKILKQKWFYKFLHMPALISLYIFSLSNSMAKIQYNLVKIDFGWINIAVNNIWDWFFYLYYGSYMFLSLVVVMKWKRKLQDRNITRQENLILLGLSAGLILGSITDIIINSMLTNPIPQMAPLFILLPVWAMYYAARHYGVLDRELYYKEELIVSGEDQKNIYINLAIIYCIGGIFSFVSEYMPIIKPNLINLKSAIIKSVLLIGIGSSILFVQKIRCNLLRERISIIILLMSIPLVTLLFLDYASITIWVFPIVIIISSLLFSKRTLLVTATIMAVLTQRLVWILIPESLVRVDKYDYIVRIAVFISVFLIGSYINKMYVSKIKDNDNQIAFQKMNLEISFDFLTINKENFDEKLNSLLSKIGLFFGVDRAYLFLINDEKEIMIYSNEWCNEGIESIAKTSKEIPLELYPWWMDQLSRNQVVSIDNINYLPIEAMSELEHLTKYRVKSLISVPIEGDVSIQGFIGMDSVECFRKWTDGERSLLNIMSGLISHGLSKIKSEEKIEFMAYYDHLTKLPNRFLFEDRVNQAIEFAKRNGKYISVVFIDLDNFKSVNDTAGHDGGDSLLVEVANSLLNIVRKSDTVSRFSGDEFMIMLNNITDYNDTVKITEKIMGLFSKSFYIKGQDFFITGSAGISIYPIDGEDAKTLIKNADTAMYKAKENGKNQFALCTTDMKKEVELSMELSNDLYRALERDEFKVYYQPQIDLSTGRINGLEALLRWFHPEKGIISPGIFIPLAEKNGLINGIGEWVLRTACYQNKKLQDNNLGYLKIAVNLSGIQFMNPHIADNVERILKETGLSPQYLELEITESIAIKELAYAEDVLNKLKRIGISIAIDDFGTEYSSLSRLKVLPIDRIKIDMQFTQGIENNEKDRAITMVIINLAKSLGLNVLAEGVETAFQKDFLSQKLCDDVQGYYYYKPMPGEEIENILLSLMGASLV